MLAILLIQEELKNKSWRVYDLNINKLKLKDILKDYEIKEQPFEYAGTYGVAELFGWQIIFFKKQDVATHTVAVSFNDIDNTELIGIANLVLKFIDIEVRFGDNINLINDVYGIADFTDNLYENMIRYGYIISPNLLMIFGLKDNTLSCLEIITDEIMIKEIINHRC